MFGFLGGAKFLTSKPFIGGLAGLVVLFTLSMGYRHYTGLLDKVETLRAAQTQLETVLDIERAAVRDLRGVIGAWEESQAELLDTIEEMQEIANDAASETRRLRLLFSEIDWAVADADSIANATSDRLWRLLRTATDSGGHGDGGAPADTTAIARPETD